MEHALLINKGDAIICQVGYSWVPRYYDLESDDIRKTKTCCSAAADIPLSSIFCARYRVLVSGQ